MRLENRRKWAQRVKQSCLLWARGLKHNLKLYFFRFCKSFRLPGEVVHTFYVILPQEDYTIPEIRGFLENLEKGLSVSITHIAQHSGNDWQERLFFWTDPVFCDFTENLNVGNKGDFLQVSGIWPYNLFRLSCRPANWRIYLQRRVRINLIYTIERYFQFLQTDTNLLDGAIKLQSEEPLHELIGVRPQQGET
jgi:hypothetical protein